MVQSTPPMLSGGWPVLGHALEMSNKLEQICQRGFKEHQGPFAINLFGKNVAVVNGPEFNKFFYTQTDKKLNISNVYDNLKSAFGETIFIGSRERYVNQRVLLQMLFTREKMASYVESMQTEVQFWIDSLGESGEVNITEDFLRLTQYVAGNAFFGPDFRKSFGPDFWQAFTALSHAISPTIPKNLPLPVNIRRDRARKLIRETLAPMIEARRTQPDRYDDVVAQLANMPQKDGTLMSEDEIANFIAALFWAGHETTAGQSAWLVTLLLQNEWYLNLIQDEIEAHLPPNSEITGGTLRNLKHIYWGIEETVRMRPAAPIQMRIVEEDIELGGYHIPAGWLIMVNGPVTHNDPTIWTDPEKFDPLRHSPERHESKNSFTNVNFGGGMHKCTGMNFAKNEMAVIVGLLFQQFEIELVTKDPHSVFGIGAVKPSDVIVKYRRK